MSCQDIDPMLAETSIAREKYADLLPEIEADTPETAVGICPERTD